LALKALYFALSNLKGKEESVIREKWDPLETKEGGAFGVFIYDMQKRRGVYKRRKSGQEA
jgi:hypothetical protein